MPTIKDIGGRNNIELPDELIPFEKQLNELCDINTKQRKLLIESNFLNILYTEIELTKNIQKAFVIADILTDIGSLDLAHHWYNLAYKLQHDKIKIKN